MIKLYLDTSVVSALFDSRNPERQNLTLSFFNEIRNFRIFISVINDMDYLLSWNFKHLVREKTREVVNMVNTTNNLKKIDIITPAEIL